MSAVVDISSDEELWGGGGSGLADGGDDDDGDWLSGILGEVDRVRSDSDDGDRDRDREKDDDSDDVVVVGEVLAKPSRLRGCSKAVVKCFTKAEDDEDDGDDDDCVVLDGDPDKPPSVQTNNNGDDGNDSDDLVVVGETGQVACRDYPHARHLCVKYPFASTPHESYCDQCHCYVCDSLAPCLHWSIAISSTDHCHATDKDDYWKNERKSVMKGSLPMAPVIPQTPLFNVQHGPPSLPSDNGQKYSIPNAIPTACAMTQQKFQLPLLSQQAQNSLRNAARTHLGLNAGSHIISRTPPRRISSLLLSNPTHSQSYSTTSTGRNGTQLARWRSSGPQAPASFQDLAGANIGAAATNLLPAVSAQQTNFVNGTGAQLISRTHGRSGNGNRYVSQPRLTTHCPRPQVAARYPQPQVAAQYLQAQVTAQFPQPRVAAREVAAMFSQSQLQAHFPQVPAYVPQPYAPHQSTYVPQQQVPPSAPQLQVPAPQNPTQLGSMSDMAGHYGSAVPYQPEPQLNVSVQGNPTQSPVYSPRDGNVAAPLSSFTAPGDLNQSTTGFESNLDYDYSTSHSNQHLPVHQVQKAVQRDEPGSAPDGLPVLPTYTSPSQPVYQFDPWALENDPGLDCFGNIGLDVVIDANLFDF